MKDLEVGMQLPGIVTNVTRFGVFVDIGVHQDGLVHISEMADRFIKDPAEVAKVQQHVMVTILDVDMDRKRIGPVHAKRQTSRKGKYTPWENRCQNGRKTKRQKTCGPRRQPAIQQPHGGSAGKIKGTLTA